MTTKHLIEAVEWIAGLSINIFMEKRLETGDT